MVTTEKYKPDWSGEDFLSRCVNVLISTKPLYELMKWQARRVIIKTAEKKGIPWRKTCQELAESPAKSWFEQINNPNLSYPDYYQVPFHAYDQGNLCWQAAFEAPAASYAVALRVWPKENLTPEVAHDRLRGTFHQVLGEYYPAPVQDVLDVGCSVGFSTLPLHRYYSQKQGQPVHTVGLDLSPYMLSVAQVIDEKKEVSAWVHGLAEKTDFPDHSFDLITIQFLLHELPGYAATEIFREMFRILRPGGCLAIVDNNPQSPVIQGLPPALFVLLKSTEPWTDDYYTFNVEEALKDVGFIHKMTVASDPRHRTIIAIKSTSGLTE